MNIEELPEEILLNIFDLLDTNQLLTCCSLVSRRWFNLINDSPHIMRKVVLHINDIVWNDIQQNSGRLARTYREVAMHCVKISDEINLNLGNVETLTLNCCTFESMRSLWRLLERCTTLKRITISYPNLLPNDSLIQIGSKGEMSRTIEEFRCSLFLSLGQSMLPKLASFQNMQVKDSFNGSDKTDEMIDYMIEHYDDSLKSLEVLGDNCSALFYTINQCQAEKSSLSLERLKICVRTVNADVFEQFMATQTKLQHFQFDVVTAENPVRIAYPNLMNLVSLHLSLRDLHDTESLCDSVSSLTKLEALKLDIFDGHTCHLQLPSSLRVLDIFSFHYPTVAKIFRFHIPVLKDMEELMLNDVFLEIDEMTRLLDKMPNLRRLRLCDSHTPWEGVSRCLPNLQKLQTLELTQQYMHDAVLCQVRAPKLKRLVWMHSYNDFMVQRITDRGLGHLDAMCPLLDLIQHGSGNILFRRNFKTRNFEKYWMDY